jgi:hypothetical protein
MVSRSDAKGLKMVFSNIVADVRGPAPAGAVAGVPCSLLIIRRSYVAGRRFLLLLLLFLRA